MFTRLAVGVDLCSGDRFVAEQLTTANRRAVDQAVLLASQARAALDFVGVLDLPDQVLDMMREDEDSLPDVRDEAQKRLEQLAADAQARGVPTASVHVALGRSWQELTRFVLKHKSEILFVGSHRRSTIESFFVGSTGQKLIRGCPGTVWITRPDRHPGSQRILVASDLSAVCNKAVSIAGEIAALQGAELHVVHALEYAWIKPLEGAGKGPDKLETWRQQRLATAKERLKNSTAGLPVGAGGPPQLHIVEALAEDAILNTIDERAIDLLVMGTVARSGWSGWFIGNTAERILGQVPCSLVVVKPDDFKCPVT